MSRKPQRESSINEYDKGENVEDIRARVNVCIQLFFRHKKYFCGGKIPQRELTSEFAERTARFTQFDDRCFNFIHDHCLPVFPVNPAYRDLTVPWPVHCLLGLFSDLKSLEIPKDNQPGMLLLLLLLMGPL